MNMEKRKGVLLLLANLTLLVIGSLLPRRGNAWLVLLSPLPSLPKFLMVQMSPDRKKLESISTSKEFSDLSTLLSLPLRASSKARGENSESHKEEGLYSKIYFYTGASSLLVPLTIVHPNLYPIRSLRRRDGSHWSSSMR